MTDCIHENWRYTRRIFVNGTSHYCAQCSDCRDLVRLPAHDFRPFIRADEIPAEVTIQEWQAPAMGDPQPDGLHLLDRAGGHE